MALLNTLAAQLVYSSVMKRNLLTVVAALAILLQGLSTAWAVMPSAATAQQQTAMNADAPVMPCHLQHASAKSPSTQADAGCCHGAHCQCAQFCSMAAAAALPTQSTTMTASHGTQVLAHALLPQISGAYTLLPIRPPITRSS